MEVEGQRERGTFGDAAGKFIHDGRCGLRRSCGFEVRGFEGGGLYL